MKKKQVVTILAGGRVKVPVLFDGRRTHRIGKLDKKYDRIANAFVVARSYAKEHGIEFDPVFKVE